MIEVQDGDSGLIELEETKIEMRLLGINAPEQEGGLWSDTACGATGPCQSWCRPLLETGTGPVWNNDGDMVLLLDESGRAAARYRHQG